MDDMEAKLGAILNNPQMMQQIMALAQNFGQTEGTPKQEAKEPVREEAAPVLPDIDLSMIQKLSSFAGKSSIDRNQQTLLKALSPYLSRQRISKLERAMRAAKMASMATVLIGNGR